MLEVQQRDHQSHRQAWAPGVALAGAGQLSGRPEQVGTFDQASRSVLVREHGQQGRLDVGPGQARGQHCQRVAHVDHRVQPGAEKVVGGHRICAPKLPGTGIDWNQSWEFAP